MPPPMIHHIDLAVSDVERSLAFYLAVLGPSGLHEEVRYPSYRGSEEIVYLRFGDGYLGLRRADGGEHDYYHVGIEHFAFFVETREEVNAAYQRCLDIGALIHFPPEEDRDIEGFYELFVFDPDGLRVEVACGPPGWFEQERAPSLAEQDGPSARTGHRPEGPGTSGGVAGR